MRHRPRLLDLFCGAGGAAVGYHRAGFDVVGVDLRPQPRYPFAFVHGDALTVDLEGFDAVHASPPCQAYSSIGRYARGRVDGLEHADLVAPVRDRLLAAGVPYVIENVEGAPLIDPVRLCGSSVGLLLRRHRLFESNFPIAAPPCAHDWQAPRFMPMDARRPGGHTARRPTLANVVGVYGAHQYAGEAALRRRAMGVDWMTRHELTQAIPPAFTELVGRFMLAHLTVALLEARPGRPRPYQLPAGGRTAVDRPGRPCRAGCGRLLPGAARADAVYCSPACRQAGYRRRTRNGFVTPSGVAS